MENNYHFKLGKNSFGEIYHVAMHGILIPEGERDKFWVKLDDLQKYSICEFFDDLGIEYKVLNKQKVDFREKTETADTISQKFDREIIDKVNKRIYNIQSVKNWKFPFADLATPDPKILIWQRNILYKPKRNSSVSLVRQLAEMAAKRGVLPVIIGPNQNIEGSYTLGDFHEDAFFKSGHSVCKQLWFQHMLFTHFGVKASVGMMSGGMDGAAMFFGHKTIFFARKSDASPRMVKVANAIPGLHWFETEYDEYLAKLNDRQLNELEEKIWPIF
jgi:hypothetical protein